VVNDTLLDYLRGHLSSGARVWSALAPALFILGYFAIAGVLYAMRTRGRGAFRDEELVNRGGGAVAGWEGRHFFAWTMRPFVAGLAKVRFPPDAVTLLSLVLALGAGVAVATGRFALGGWLFIAAGALDFLDGRLARTTGRTSAGGAALDSVLDRYVESALIVGLCWYYRDGWVLAVCLVALTGSLLVPYVRARGEALGVAMVDSGFMQRPERVLVLGLGTALSPILEVVLAPGDPSPPHWLAIAALVLLGAGSHVSAVQRLLSLRRALGAGAPHPARSGRGSAWLSAFANAAATCADFAVAAGLVQSSVAGPALSTAAGCAVGAVVSFTLSRHLAFRAGGGAAAGQVVRYSVVSLLTLALNAGGVSLLLLLNLPFVVAWAVARAVVFLAWSYPVQRDFVFVSPEPASGAIPAPEPSGVTH
jgi:phosphatidylglycerophosphate synthase